MVRFSHEEIPSDSDDPSGYGFAKDVARQARNAACSLYDKYPGAASAGTVPGSPAQQWIDAFWRDMCRKAPGTRPPQPKQQYSGGQCDCVAYTVRFRLLFNNGTATGQSFFGVTGKIRGFTSTDLPNGSRQFTCLHMVCTNGVPSPAQSNFELAAISLNPRLEIISITRNDGQPDNCGSPPPSWLPPFNGTPGAGEKIKPYVPRNPDSPGSGWNISIPFAFIDADANVNVDVGGVNLNFDLGGVTFNIDNKFGDGSPGSVGGEPPDLSGLEGAIEAAKNAAEGAKNAAEAAKKRIDDRNNNDGDDPQNDPNKQEKEPKQEDDPKEEDGIERLLAVEVELLSKPSNRRTQDGGDAPNVEYAGWFEFKTKGSPHPRVPIHFERNYYIAPTGADGYAYTVYNGFAARAIVITAKATQ